jgi:hypothetical protein
VEAKTLLEKQRLKQKEAMIYGKKLSYIVEYENEIVRVSG